MKFRVSVAALMLGGSLLATQAMAAELSVVLGDTGNGLTFLRGQLDIYEKKTGNKVKVVPMPTSTTDQFAQYRQWLAQGDSGIDVFHTDVIWAPQLADQLLDLTDAAKDVVKDHFPSIIESQTVNGKLVALPAFTDAPALYYRKDLLEKHGEKVPATWEEMAATAKKIQEAEHAGGAKDMWGFVWQGKAYEGLTCDALEWVKSSGGGQIIEPDGSISINNPKAAAAIERAKGWVGTISPPGVTGYTEEESRGVWQTGNAVFMRNWPYAYTLGNGDDSKVKGKFDVAPLPSGGAGSAATLGGWNVAVSKHSKSPKEAVDLALFLSSKEVQKARALQQSNLPTIVSLYDDEEIKAKQPIIPRWKEVFLNAVPRPSAPAKQKYNEVSAAFWTAVSDTLSGKGSAADNLKALEVKLVKLKGAAWR